MMNMKCFWVGLQFLTRIRVVKQEVWTDEDFGGSVKFFPLYGLIIGGILALGYYTLSQIFPPMVTAVCILLLEVAITGGIHLDGFMDTMDGIFSGRSAERILEIMKDSRVGAHSVIALGLLYLIKFSMYYEFPSEMLIPVLIFMPVLGRWAMVMGITSFPYARPEGMGKSFHQYAGRNAFTIGTIITLGIAAAFQWIGIITFVVTAAFVYLFCRRITKQIGGLTGDVYGAATELTQVTAMFVIYVVATWGWTMML
jgi:adenosylcobinamide-GDP ribazoletransferase